MNADLIDEVNGVVRTGRRLSCTMHSEVAPICTQNFQTTLTEFKNRMDYVRETIAFLICRTSHTKTQGKVVKVWAEKEYKKFE